MKKLPRYTFTMDDVREVRKFTNDSNSESDYTNEVLNLLNDNKDLGIDWSDLGIDESQLDDIKYQHPIEDDIKDEGDRKDFNKQEFKVTNLYKYVSDVYGSSEIGPNSRGFCKNLVARTKVSAFRYKDILSITPNKGFGQGGSNIYSVYKFRGGTNCKHYWKMFKYDSDTESLIEAPTSEQPVQVNKGSV